MTERVVVIGNGMAGFRFVKELSGTGREFAVTVIGDEPGGAYNRVQLSGVLAGRVRADSIELADPDWYARRGVRLLAGVAATMIDRPARRVQIAGGSTVRYDVLVLATGSRPVLPPLPGLLRDGRLLPGAAAFRTLADTAEVSAQAADAAIVLGGGVLGLEIACGLAGLGVGVTLLQRGTRLMDHQLDAGAARVLAQRAADLGVRVLTGATVHAVLGQDLVRGVELADGTVLGAGLLVLCCGTRPRAELARAAGLAVRSGILVRDTMRSVTDERVFAIGECAEHRGRTPGLVAPCWEQARVAAHVLADPGTCARYAGSADVIRLKAAGIDLASMGESTADDSAPGGPEVVTFSDPSRRVYQKLVVRDGRLTGAILLGDTRAAGTITQLFDRGAPVPGDRAALLLGRREATAGTDSPVLLPGDATICQCNGVTKAAICAAWQDGARDVDAVAVRTRATTGCGTCQDAVRGVVGWLAAADPVPA